MSDPRWTTFSADEVTWTLIGEAFRGFLLEKHLPASELDAWADELVSIVREHLLTEGYLRTEDSS